MIPSRTALVLIAATLAVSFAGCGSDTPTTPTPPTTNVTEAFSGTLTVNGAATHSFTASGTGTVTVTLTSLTPAARLGISVGNYSVTTASCSAVLSNDFALSGAELTAQVSAKANLCVRIYDTGYLTEPVDYAITVSHP